MRSSSAHAVTAALLFMLPREAFYRVGAHFPEILESMSIVAAARDALNKKQSLTGDDLLQIKVCGGGGVWWSGG